MTIHHMLYRKMTILIPTLPQVPEYVKSKVRIDGPQSRFTVPQ